MRLAGYDRNGEEISEADVLSDDELAEDYARIRSGGSSRRGFRVPAPERRPRTEDELDRLERFWPTDRKPDGQ